MYIYVYIHKHTYVTYICMYTLTFSKYMYIFMPGKLINLSLKIFTDFFEFNNRQVFISLI